MFVLRCGLDKCVIRKISRTDSEVCYPNMMKYVTAYLLLSQAIEWFNRGFAEGNEAATLNYASFFLRPSAAAVEAEGEEEEEEQEEG